MQHLFLVGFDALAAQRLAPVLEQVGPLLAQLGADVPIFVQPTGLNSHDARAAVYFDTDGVHLAVAPRLEVTAADLAHEVMHLLLDLEGYPTLGGDPDAGAIASWLLDGEVDRRVVAAGYDATADTDRDFARRARAKLRHWDEDRLLGSYIVWHTTATRLEALRAAWSARVRAQRPHLAQLGDAVVRVLGEGTAMHSAAGASRAMTDAYELLRAAALPVGTLGYAGPEIETLRRTHWPQRLTQLLPAVADQEPL